jgi:hypothetical protein
MPLSEMTKANLTINADPDGFTIQRSTRWPSLC